MNQNNSNNLFQRAQTLIPGGVNSPVRAFKAVGGEPLFFSSAKGAYMTDVDENQYIDLINSWGPMILGHCHPEIEQAITSAVKKSISFGAPTPSEVEMAQVICSMVPSIEKVRMVNSGTEATMSAVRLARGFTGKDKIIKFEGCYHGHGDSFLIAAGSGALTMGVPNSPGVTSGTAKDTLIAKFNDLDSVNQLVDANRHQVAALIVEPVAGNMGCVLPREGFLQGLRELCTAEGILLIFDEVMTGFRVSQGGAQQFFNVYPDLTTLGKIIGGGMPVGAYGGKKEIMDYISPDGPVYQAGTLSGNPVAMAAGLAMLNHLRNQGDGFYSALDEITTYIAKGIKRQLDELGLPFKINQLGSMMSVFFTKDPVYDFETAAGSDAGLFRQYFQSMLSSGIYLPPSQYESWFISTAITKEISDQILDASFKGLQSITGK
ncbi:MAG: glutamate-1-semialdehyde 2,1-aminomutase [Cyclobacteriaceae bacterium]|nr:MAG: glutamate-1-semialdehyde 2,1-aminomutase [Cyclobacteriaceae bacterium]